MEIICINSSFTGDQLQFFGKYKISLPVKNKIYGVREVVKNTGKIDSQDNIGFLLDEIKNPKIPQMHPVLGAGGIEIEPNFSIKRFKNLDSTEITAEQAKNEMKLIEANNILTNKKIN